MKIPIRLLQLLERDRALYSATLQALEEFRPWMELSGTPFFPEYTRHDPDHVESVLQTAAAILRDEAWPILTAADAAVLVVAGLLHDAAMHLTDDGFLQLINPRLVRAEVLLPSDRPWPILWEEYLSLARRFNGRELRNLYGDLEPVRQPASDPRDWTLRDRLLIGDFLRRHHHRLAHEIARWGVPGRSGGEPLRLSLEKDLADLAGLVARSHGMPLRELFDPLRTAYDLRQYRGVHAVFLMVLLRISDYLQVEADRAPKQLLQVKRLWSPLSLGKWKEHQAVRDIRTTHEDPEAIFVDTLPQDVDRYLALKELLSGLQEELDVSWAVLGEVYGRWEELKGLGLTPRRVRSTLDDEEAFGLLVEYVPRRAAFEAASGDLIPLLVEPLYGDKPEIGVRELIQNSLDAVRELWLYREALQINLAGTQDPDINVEVRRDSNEGSWLIVEDQGIGMTIDTICSYFLKVGASFRRSDLWRKTFEDQAGKSLILRSGRFGIGALAAFLLGEELEVSTRHIDSTDGFCFRAKLDTDNIELRRCHRSIGTTIKVRLSVNSLKALAKAEAWDWFCLSEPKMVRRVWDVHAKKPRNLAQVHTLPSSRVALPQGWHRILVPDYEDVQWTYAKVPALVCNGIKITHGLSTPLMRLESVSDGWSLRTPNLSIFDPDGKLPLNLSRTALTQKELPFQSELLEDVTRDFIAHAALTAPRSRWEKMTSGYAGLPPAQIAWFHSPEGTGILTGHNLQVARAGRSVVAVPYYLIRKLLNSVDTSLPSPIVWFDLDNRKLAIDHWIRKILGAEPENFLWRILSPRGVRLLIRKDWADRLRTGKDRMRLPRWAMSRIRKEKDFSAWELWASGACPDSTLEFVRIGENSETFAEELPVVLAEIYPKPSINSLASTPIDLLWQKHVGRPTIPYDWKQRRHVLRHTFTELRPYIEAYKGKEAEQPSTSDEREVLESD